MSSVYGHHKPVRSYYYSLFQRYLFAILTVVFLVGIAAGLLLYDLSHSNKTDASTGPAQSRLVGPVVQTFRGPYFQFQDTGKWVFNTRESTDNKFVYYKYHGLEVQHQLIIYVNQVPPPLNLTSTRVLPIYIVSGNSFQASNVSGPCSQAYGPDDLHRVKEVVLNQATLLCDPDSPQYRVIFSEVAGNYRLKLKRLDGSPIQFVVIYSDLTLDPGPMTVKNVANSFQAL